MSPSLPKTYKAAVITKVGGPLEIQDIELKQPEKGQVLVKTVACGVCHSDVAVQQGAFGDLTPRIPGHEIVGDVVVVGEGVESIKVGDRIGGAWHGGHDGTCKQCQRGFFQACQNETVNGVFRDGGYAEYVLLRAEAAVPVSKELDPYEVAPLLCAGVTVFNSIRNMKVRHGGIVAVQGLGGLGHLALQYASKMGYRTVALSSGPEKEEFARKLGAHEYLDAKSGDLVEGLNKLGGADLIVCTAPNPEVIAPLVNGVAVQGNLLILAPVGELKIDSTPLILKAVGVRGWPSGNQLDSEEAIEFAGHHNVKCMIEKFTLQQASEAWEKMNSGKIRFRGVLTFE